MALGGRARQCRLLSSVTALPLLLRGTNSPVLMSSVWGSILRRFLWARFRDFHSQDLSLPRASDEVATGRRECRAWGLPRETKGVCCKSPAGSPGRRACVIVCTSTRWHGRWHCWAMGF